MEPNPLFVWHLGWEILTLFGMQWRSSVQLPPGCHHFIFPQCPRYSIHSRHCRGKNGSCQWKSCYCAILFFFQSPGHSVGLSTSGKLHGCQKTQAIVIIFPAIPQTNAASRALWENKMVADRIWLCFGAPFAHHGNNHCKHQKKETKGQN